MVGEGIGMIMLKRLEDAKKDGPEFMPLSTLNGTSSDGNINRSTLQDLKVRRLRCGALTPVPAMARQTADLIEAHGTGTMAGDPAEFAGLREVFSENNPKKQHIALKVSNPKLDIQKRLPVLPV